MTMMDGPMDGPMGGMMDGPMGGQMEEQMVLLQNMSTDWGNWMQSVGAQEVVVEVEGVGMRAAVTSRVLRPRGILRRAQWAENEMPVELVREAVRLRALMAHPRGGTWTWAALSMKTDSAFLHVATVCLALACVVLAAVVPYARARAKSIGATASVGIAERTDRLVVALVATFVVGLGAPQWVLSAALGYVALASFITVVQRIVVVSRQMAGRAIAADGVEQETSV